MSTSVDQEHSKEMNELTSATKQFKVELSMDDVINSRRKTKWMRGASSREEVLLSKLHTLLLKLSPDRRRSALKELFSQNQRLRLEHWILARKPQLESLANRLVTRHFSHISQQQLKAVAPSDECTILQRKCHLDRHNFAKLHRVPSMVRNPQSNGCYYMAKVSVRNINLLSRADRNVRLVEKFHSMLLVVRQKAVSGIAGAFKTSFRKSIFESLEEFCLDASDMGLRFFISFRPLWEPRPLCTGVYHFTELDAGLQAWQRLTDAHSKVRQQLKGYHSKAVPPEELVRAWQGFHDTYLDVMADAGYSMDAIKERLQTLETRQFAQQELCVQAWNRSQMMRQERQQSAIVRRQKRLAAQAAQCRKCSQDIRVQRSIMKVLQAWTKMRSRDDLLPRRRKSQRTTWNRRQLMHHSAPSEVKAMQWY